MAAALAAIPVLGHAQGVYTSGGSYAFAPNLSVGSAGSNIGTIGSRTINYNGNIFGSWSGAMNYWRQDNGDGTATPALQIKDASGNYLTTWTNPVPQGYLTIQAVWVTVDGAPYLGYPAVQQAFWYVNGVQQPVAYLDSNHDGAITVDTGAGPWIAGSGTGFIAGLAFNFGNTGISSYSRNQNDIQLTGNSPTWDSSFSYYSLPSFVPEGFVDISIDDMGPCFPDGGC